MIPPNVATIMVDEAAFNAALEAAVTRIRNDRLLTIGGITLMMSRYLPAGTTLMLDRAGHLVRIQKKQPAATAIIVDEPAPIPVSPEGAGA